MKRALTTALSFLLSAISLCAEEAAEWKAESNSKGVAIHSRPRSGSSLREFKGVGMIEAPPSAVFAVLDDSEAYTSFMPYTLESRVLHREKDSVLVYQRLELPLIKDRDYTLLTRFEKWDSAEGPVYRLRWAPANDAGPAPRPGVLRVTECEGGWLLEPHGKSATRATYSIFTDSGGIIPAALQNTGSRMAIRKLFEAVRKQVRHPKYANAKE